MTIKELEIRTKYAGLMQDRDQIKEKLAKGIAMFNEKPIEEAMDETEYLLDITWSELNSELNRQLEEKIYNGKIGQKIVFKHRYLGIQVQATIDNLYMLGGEQFAEVTDTHGNWFNIRTASICETH